MIQEVRMHEFFVTRQVIISDLLGGLCGYGLAANVGQTACWAQNVLANGTFWILATYLHFSPAEQQHAHVTCDRAAFDFFFLLRSSLVCKNSNACVCSTQ